MWNFLCVSVDTYVHTSESVLSVIVYATSVQSLPIKVLHRSVMRCGISGIRVLPVKSSPFVCAGKFCSRSFHSKLLFNLTLECKNKTTLNKSGDLVCD